MNGESCAQAYWSLATNLVCPQTGAAPESPWTSAKVTANGAMFSPKQVCPLGPSQSVASYSGFSGAMLAFLRSSTHGDSPFPVHPGFLSGGSQGFPPQEDGQHLIWCRGPRTQELRTKQQATGPAGPSIVLSRPFSFPSQSPSPVLTPCASRSQPSPRPRVHLLATQASNRPAVLAGLLPGRPDCPAAQEPKRSCLPPARGCPCFLPENRSRSSLPPPADGTRAGTRLFVDVHDGW